MIKAQKIPDDDQIDPIDDPNEGPGSEGDYEDPIDDSGPDVVPEDPDIQRNK
ncbi:hypothetical protein [Azomonas macrocytogenes]|uniref:Uncharacterized protein n=1 Tax=Azomonas macrocytogenes TaxID=69962 RepID=A0A839T4M0_AZOMA|nr:hypothetical protein [Azomonas macrocytogenes]MBB3103700.1 hypothetical protein [Azomonas macrocytogenes]